MENFRRRIHRMYRKYRAILVLTNATTADDRIRVDSNLSRLTRMPAAKLRANAKELDRELKRLVDHYGVVASLEELEKVFDQPLKRQGTVQYISKYDLSAMFEHYERALPIFPHLPQHGRVAVDTAAVRTDRSLAWFVLEASLFEDMAALWNAAVAASRIAERTESTLPQFKLATSLRRATVKAAFNLIEGYLNGIALDVLLLRKVPPEIEVKLEEWDPERNRPVRLTLRDKILQYVKIACAVEHPPIQESNSAAMRTILEAESRVRHALIHPTARVTPEDTASRETVFFDLSLEAVAEICDAVVALIREIAAVVGNDFGDVGWWTYERTEDECYPEAAFL